MNAFKISNTKGLTDRLAAITAFLLMCAVSASAYKQPGSFSQDSVGTTSADFLNLPIGARATAMGGAYSAVSEEASAIYWNPAGLVQIPKLSALFMRSQYVGDVSYQYAAFAHRLSFDSVLAVSALMTDIGSIEQTNMDGQSLGKFSPRDQVYTLAYSLAVLEFSDKDMDMSVGMSAKYIESQILRQAHSFAGDFGVMAYNFSSIPYRLAVTMANYGSGLRYDQESSPLPLTFRMGGAVSFSKNILLSADMVLPKQNAPNFLIGSEFTADMSETTRLALRGGLNTQRLKDGISGFTLGAGVELNFFSIDYAFVPMGELGTAHKITLSVDFPFRTPVFSRRDRSIFTKQKSISIKK